MNYFFKSQAVFSIAEVLFTSWHFYLTSALCVGIVFAFDLLIMFINVNFFTSVINYFKLLIAYDMQDEISWFKPLDK